MIKHDVTLAISIKARRLGIAVLDGKQLLFYQMINLGNDPKGRFKVARDKLQNLINTYQPQRMTVEQLIYIQQKTPVFNELSTILTKVAQKNNLSITAYSPETVRNHFCQNDKSNKERVAQFLIGQYPELNKLIYRQSHWQRFYAMQIFSAIALGLYSFNEDNQEQ